MMMLRLLLAVLCAAVEVEDFVALKDEAAAKAMVASPAMLHTGREEWAIAAQTFVDRKWWDAADALVQLAQDRRQDVVKSLRDVVKPFRENLEVARKRSRAAERGRLL